MTPSQRQHRRLRHGHHLAGRPAARPSWRRCATPASSQVMLTAHDLVGHPDGWRGRGAGGEGQRAARDRLPGAARLRGPVGPPARLQDRHRQVDAGDVPCARLPRVAGLFVDLAARHGRHRRWCRDLRKLAMLAMPMNIKIAYEALSWGRTINEFPQAWDVICAGRHAQPRAGLRLVPRVRDQDPARRAGDAGPATRSFWCSWPISCGGDPDGRRAHQHRAHLPRVSGRGRAQRGAGRAGDAGCDHLGYRGDYSFEVFNDDYQQMPLATVANARAARPWLGETCCAARCPLPNQIRLKHAARA